MDVVAGVGLHAQGDVEVLVLVVHFYFFVAFEELDLLESAAVVLVGNKVSLEVLGDIGLIKYKLPVFVQLRIISIDILQLDLSPTDLPQQRPIHKTINWNSLKHGFANHNSQ